MIANPALPDHAAVRVFPPAVPLLTIAAGIALTRWFSPPFAMPTSTWVRWFGIAIAVGAVLLLGAWSVTLVRRSGQNENPWKPTTGLITEGPFRVTRNPMYLQMVLVCIGVGLALANPFILLLTPLCAVTLQWMAIQPEERYLERKFGAEYLAYKARVRRWI